MRYHGAEGKVSKMRKAWWIAAGSAVLAVVVYVMVWACIDEMRWGRPEYAVYCLLAAAMVAERVRWMIPES
jgi:flagellar biosynthesis/type III secretory pathway M-ring protein FliF/YscJ